MKINQKIVFLSALVCAVLFPTGPLSAHLDTIDTIDAYFDNPSLIAASQMTLPDMKVYFDRAHVSQYTTRSSEADKPSEGRSISDFFSQAMSEYISEIYNDIEYGNQLSHDGNHIIDFLSLAEQFNLGEEEVYTGLRLFHNKLKEPVGIDDTVVTYILDQLPIYLEQYFPLLTSKAPDNFLTHPAQVIENCMLTHVTEHLPKLKAITPTDFFESLSQKIGNLTSENLRQIDTNNMRERLRSQVVQFVDLLLSKVIWYPENYEGIWENVKTCAQNIHLLGANGIINHMDDIDSCLWTLTYQFCKFLHTFGSQLPLDFHDTIKHDLLEQYVPFLEDAEVDDGIKTKKEHIVQALANAETKAIAFAQQGLFSE